MFQRKYDNLKTQEQFGEERIKLQNPPNVSRLLVMLRILQKEPLEEGSSSICIDQHAREKATL